LKEREQLAHKQLSEKWSLKERLEGRGTQVEKSWKLQWMRGEYCEAPSPGTENPGGWGQTGKKPP